MAKLIQCKSCNHSISKKAKSCPNCGAPNKQTSLATWIVAAMFAVVVFNAVFLSNSTTSTPTKVIPKKAKTSFVEDQSTNAQIKRKGLIKKLIDNGIFHKIDVPAELPHIFVTDKFMSLSFDDKQSFTGVVLAYYHTKNNSVDIAVLKNYRNDEKVGTITKRGLKLN